MHIYLSIYDVYVGEGSLGFVFCLLWSFALAASRSTLPDTLLHRNPLSLSIRQNPSGNTSNLRGSLKRRDAVLSQVSFSGLDA